MNLEDRGDHVTMVQEGLAFRLAGLFSQPIRSCGNVFLCMYGALEAKYPFLEVPFGSQELNGGDEGILKTRQTRVVK